MTRPNHSVGDGGVNDKEDVKVIKELLDKVPVNAGRPQKKFRVGPPHIGKDPQLIRAICEFQMFHFHCCTGRIDPGNVTIKLLRKLEAGGLFSVVNAAINDKGAFFERIKIVDIALHEADRPDKVAGAVKKAGKQSTPASAVRLKEYFTVFDAPKPIPDADYENGYPGGAHWCGIFAAWVLVQHGINVRFEGGDTGRGIYQVADGKRLPFHTNLNYAEGDVCLTKENPNEPWPTHHFMVYSKPPGASMMVTIEGNYADNGLFHAVGKNKRAVQPYGHYSVLEPKSL